MMGPNSLLHSLMILLLLITIQCKTPALSQSAIDDVIRTRIGSSYSTHYNALKTLGLYTQEFSPQNNGKQKVKFMVVELSSHKILEEGSYLNGHVKWRDNTSLEVLNMPGVLKKGQSTRDFKKVIYLKNLTSKTP